MYVTDGELTTQSKCSANVRLSVEIGKAATFFIRAKKLPSQFIGNSIRPTTLLQLFSHVDHHIHWENVGPRGTCLFFWA